MRLIFSAFVAFACVSVSGSAGAQIQQLGYAEGEVDFDEPGGMLVMS